MAAQQLETKKELADKKQQDKMTRWLQIREDEQRKAEFQERKICLGETKIRAGIIAEENRVMMLDPNAMDTLMWEPREIRRAKIVEERRAAPAARAASASGRDGGGDRNGCGASASGGGGDGSGAAWFGSFSSILLWKIDR